MIPRGVGYTKIPQLRAVCARCPVAGHCLSEALDEDPRIRVAGPLRVGHTGPVWATIADVATFLDVTTDDDFDTLAAWLLDGVLALHKHGHRHWTAELLDDDQA
jgi:hypothetical protein